MTERWNESTVNSLIARAILFDGAGTLLHVHPSVGSVYAEEAKRFGACASVDSINAAFRSAWRELRPYADGKTPFHTSEAIERAWWRTLVQRVFDEACGPDAFADRFESFFNALYLRFEEPDVWRLYDDVIPTLDALRARNIPIAIVSNWDSRLPRLLKAMGLADRFEFILTSAEAGVSKPSQKIFEQALVRLGIPAHEVLHVGDSLEDDVIAAQNAGLQSLHIVRNDTSSQDGKAIHSLKEIIDRISR
ncbi:MAG: HAD-IA family hydrolase [Candidatus Hydrogenedentes bacterium]|nr:HAD-IA family hydrolase [Candidatus Hydrogenedentota bacterium]